jgi:hypothetical protein
MSIMAVPRSDDVVRPVYRIAAGAPALALQRYGTGSSGGTSCRRPGTRHGMSPERRAAPCAGDARDGRQQQMAQQLLVVCSSNAAIVAALVDEGFATMTRGSVQVGGKMIEVPTVPITDSRRDSLVSED